MCIIFDISHWNLLCSFYRIIQVANTQSSRNTWKHFPLTAVNGLWNKKIPSHFPSGLIEVTVSSVVSRWPPPSQFDPVTHFLSHLSVGLRGGVSPSEHQGSRSVCVSVRLHFYVDLMFTQRVPACVWIIQSCSYTHTHFAIPVAPRLCCQPLLLICTRQAGKNPNLSAALHLFCITISLLLFLLLLFNPSSLQCLRFHVFCLFLPAIRLCLSLSHTLSRA